jgi:hypothetical protein
VNMSSKFRILIAVVLIVLMLEIGSALFAIYLIGPSVNPIVDFKTTVFLLVLNASSFTFLISQLWSLRLRAKVVKSIFFIWVMLILTIALGAYIKDLLIQPLFTTPLNDVLTIFVVGAIHPFVWLSLILPTIGVFCGEHGLYLLFKRIRKQRQANQTNFWL